MQLTKEEKLKVKAFAKKLVENKKVLTKEWTDGEDFDDLNLEDKKEIRVEFKQFVQDLASRYNLDIEEMAVFLGEILDELH